MFKIDNTANGISATLTGFKKEDLTAKIEACQEGACECACDPEVMKKIENIEVNGCGREKKTTVTLDIAAENSATLMKECRSDLNNEQPTERTS